MGIWSKDELRKIGEADDLHIAAFREDGVTYGTPTWNRTDPFFRSRLRQA